jgi:DNA helicase-2/ATP-dependent DNA helicase PcrA
MDSALALAISKLSEIQREAVDWDNGALLVLAGPGSGKTQVLTCRIARLLDASRAKSFRILALTFTNKAADEMKERVASFVPGLEERANIGTFHGFAGQMLRQHGVHIGIKPDFAIYALDSDREAVLEDAIKRGAKTGLSLGVEDARFLSIIDSLKSRLVPPEQAPRALARNDERDRIVLAYTVYEDELRRINALDFNSLILEANRLTRTFPAIAGRYQRSHPFWLLDEFQDTNDAQYQFISTLAGEAFRNLFVVADDDQIIYQWNGASFRQIQNFQAGFDAALLQLPTNFRCPPAIVQAANRLVAYNMNRSVSKRPLEAGKSELKLPSVDHIQLRHFTSDQKEAMGIAEEIAERPSSEWGEIAIIGRSRGILEGMLAALKDKGVPAVMAQRRDEFLSAQFRWLMSCLIQVARPLDRRNIFNVVDSFNRLCGLSISAEEILAEAEASQQPYLAVWLAVAKSIATEFPGLSLLDILSPVLSNTSLVREMVEQVVDSFERGLSDREDDDLREDAVAWRELSRDISRHIGRAAPLGQFLQELQLRSKEPSPKPGTITLITIHGAKGREFDIVYLVGLAEDILPSYQSRKKGDASPEMEEERRNCFVAITRAKECLILSRADSYRGWSKSPSRFLVEMGFVTD